MCFTFISLKIKTPASLVNHFCCVVEKSLRSTYGAYKRRTQGLVKGKLRERDHLENLGVDRSIILKWIFMKWDNGHELDRAG